jgi:hypothetical protein
MECTTEFFDLAHYLKAMIGLNGASDTPMLRLMQVESTGDYFECAKVEDIENPLVLFRLLLDKNHCDQVVLRVDISTDDGLCKGLEDCNQKELSAYQAAKFAIGKAADGAPVLRIMLSSGLS